MICADDFHCDHWFDCEPCCRCGYDGGGEDCDCPRHTAERAAKAIAEACRRSNPSSTLQFVKALRELGYEVVAVHDR